MKKTIGVTLCAWILASCSAAPEEIRPQVQTETSSSALSGVKHETQNWLATTESSNLEQSLRIDDIGLKFMSHAIYGSDHLPSDALAVDLDQDGDIDLVSTHVAYVSKVNIVWHENVGVNNFVGHEISNSAQGAADVDVADIDGDGNLDIIAASEGEGLSWYRNDGHQAFKRKAVGSTIGVPSRVQVVDVDKDGKLDLLASSYRESRIAWYKNDGRGGFTEFPLESPAREWAKEIEATDFDGDGDADVLVGYQYEKATPLVLFENSNGAFVARGLPVSTRGVVDFSVVDLDNDGDIDIVGSVSGNPDDFSKGAELVWYENLGGLRLAKHTIDVREGSPDKLVVGDLNQDGRNDILWKTSLAKSVDWYEHKADHSFARNLAFADAGYTQSLRLGDVDRDGDLDVLTTNYDKGVRWLENRSNGVRLHAQAQSGSSIWLINRGGPQWLEKGKSYLVSFSSQVNEEHPLAKVQFGMARAWDQHGPHLPQGAFEIPAVSTHGQSSDSSVIVRPESSGTFYPSFALSWASSTSVNGEYVIKDINVTELVDNVAFRVSPLMVEAGQSHLIAVDYSAVFGRDIRVDLIDGTAYVAGTQVTVPAGIGLAKVQVTVPTGLVDSSNLKWYIKILPQDGQWFEMLREVKTPVSLAKVVGTPISYDSLFFKGPVYALDGIHRTQKPSPHAWGFSVRVNRIEQAPLLGEYGIAMSGSADVAHLEYFFNFKTGLLDINDRSYNCPVDDPDDPRNETLRSGAERYLEGLDEMRQILNRVVTGDHYREGDRDVGSTIVYLEQIMAQLTRPRSLAGSASNAVP